MFFRIQYAHHIPPLAIVFGFMGKLDPWLRHPMYSPCQLIIL
jgi:hypothetical protein